MIGGAGLDTVYMWGSASSSIISRSGDVTFIKDMILGDVDILTSDVEQAEFLDGIIVVFDFSTQLATDVYKLYQAAFARMPDNVGFRYWVDIADKTHLALNTVSNFFLTSTEFAQKYVVATNAQFISALYHNVLGRDPDAQGAEYWVKELNSGHSRGQALVDFALSNENAVLVGNHIINGFWTTAF
jgi:serralysin